MCRHCGNHWILFWLQLRRITPSGNGNKSKWKKDFQNCQLQKFSILKLHNSETGGLSTLETSQINSGAWNLQNWVDLFRMKRWVKVYALFSNCPWIFCCSKDLRKLCRLFGIQWVNFWLKLRRIITFRNGKTFQRKRIFTKLPTPKFENSQLKVITRWKLQQLTLPFEIYKIQLI